VECKNCHTNLRTDYSFCPDCGAKVIRHRITLKNLSFDIFERYFNLDNSFLKTFLHLFSKPEVVLSGYISGTRKKYLNPISYLGIALTLSGITVFLIKKFYASNIDFTGGSNNMNPEFAEKYSEFVFDYSSFMFLIYFPVLALPAYLLFNKIKYNFSEYIVVFIYIMAHYSIVTFPIGIGTLVINPDYYVEMSKPLLVATLLYSIYVLQRLNRYSIKNLLWKSVIYLFLVITIFFITIMGIMLILMLTGVFNLNDFASIN
jgi:hypothetical protein